MRIPGTVFVVWWHRVRKVGHFAQRLHGCGGKWWYHHRRRRGPAKVWRPGSNASGKCWWMDFTATSHITSARIRRCHSSITHHYCQCIPPRDRSEPCNDLIWSFKRLTLVGYTGAFGRVTEELQITEWTVEISEDRRNSLWANQKLLEYMHVVR